MVKILLAFCLFICPFKADVIDEIVENLIGKESYITNQNFIKRIFTKKENFYIKDDYPNYFKITQVLKENGLMYLGFQEPIEVSISFKAKTRPIFLTRAINNILSSVGYSYFTISRAKYSGGDVYLTFSLVAEHSVDPVIVLAELKKRGILAKKVVRKNRANWFYELEIVNSSIVNAVFLKNNERFELKNISGEYWLSVDRAGILSIMKKNTKVGWSPRIVFYDKNLQVLEILTQRDFAVSTDVNVTDKTSFIMITDLNNPARLKSGIAVTFASFQDSRAGEGESDE